MGIPKFYRWISERYPCLSEKIREYQIPEFDNLYLDMNGIIHTCSHPNDDDVHLRIPEEYIFRDIFRYLDFLFKMIKPRKMFFMAVDGVAPRAKMNQQRGRRFRSAKLAEDQEAEAIRNGEVLPDEERFDSNCITPGTEFMARLHGQLKYFVQVKMSTDPLWQRPGLTVILSGHDVPGEGEHKIMDFIRHIRSNPDYDAETRHCLYGLDADLIMLGLSTHELRFSLLREEVKFSRRPKSKSKKKKKTGGYPETGGADTKFDLTNVSIFTNDGVPNGHAKPAIDNSSTVTEGQSFTAALQKVPVEPENALAEKGFDFNEILKASSLEGIKNKQTFRPPLPEKTTFFLLHISLLRDYIDEEFQELAKSLETHDTLKYDVEKVIDDWILLSILVGNDFVPHLPNLHIVKGALPMLYKLYMKVLPTLDGYINESGVLNLPRFEALLHALSAFDFDEFRLTYDDMVYMESKTGKNIVLGQKMFEEFPIEGDDADCEELEALPPELRDLINRSEEEFNSNSEKNVELEEVFGGLDEFITEEDGPEFRTEFFHHKRNYYAEKLKIEKLTKETMSNLTVEYVRAVQWILLYYYKGVSSWGWFYPYHYAPFTSDLKEFSKAKITFELGQPFKPFEQLLGVLPAQSKKLLPKVYHELMTSDDSPLAKFYPNEFENDLNGKRQDWEAVVLIPFIEQNLLLRSMELVASQLSVEEQLRNSRGAMCSYRFTQEDTEPVISPGNIFPPLPTSHVHESKINEMSYDQKTLPRGIHPKAKRDQIYQGFPTLKSKTHTSEITQAKVKVFDFEARDDSLVLTMDSEYAEATALSIGTQILGKSVWLNWPHLTPGVVTGVSDYKTKYYLNNHGKMLIDPAYNPTEHEKIVENLLTTHKRFKGIVLTDTSVVIWAKLMEGRKIRCDSNGSVICENQWSTNESTYPLQGILAETDKIVGLRTNQCVSYTDLYQVGQKVIVLQGNLFGSVGVVKGYDNSSTKVIAEFKNSEKDFAEDLMHQIRTRMLLRSNAFFSTRSASQQCGINTGVFSRLTGSIQVILEKTKNKNNKKLVENNGDGDNNVKSSDVDANDSSDESEFQQKGKKINIGLNLKFNARNLEVRGYTRKSGEFWEYSAKTVELVKEFNSVFPDFIQFLSNDNGGKKKDNYMASDIFKENGTERVQEIIDWLDDHGIHQLEKVPLNSKILDENDIEQIWKRVLDLSKTMPIAESKTVNLNPSILFKPGVDSGLVTAVPDVGFSLLDRVVCVDPSSSIPLGHYGTIVGIENPPRTDAEVAFTATSGACLQNLIILCDPLKDIFDPLEKEQEDLSLKLRNFLMIGPAPTNKVEKAVPAPRETAHDDKKCVLVKLFPFQLLNLTRNEALRNVVPMKMVNTALNSYANIAGKRGNYVPPSHAGIQMPLPGTFQLNTLLGLPTTAAVKNVQLKDNSQTSFSQPSTRSIAPPSNEFRPTKILQRSTNQPNVVNVPSKPKASMDIDLYMNPEVYRILSADPTEEKQKEVLDLNLTKAELAEKISELNKEIAILGEQSKNGVDNREKMNDIFRNMSALEFVKTDGEYQKSIANMGAMLTTLHSLHIAKPSNQHIGTQSNHNHRQQGNNGSVGTEQSKPATRLDHSSVGKPSASKDSSVRANREDHDQNVSARKSELVPRAEAAGAGIANPPSTRQKNDLYRGNLRLGIQALEGIRNQAAPKTPKTATSNSTASGGSAQRKSRLAANIFNHN